MPTCIGEKSQIHYQTIKLQEKCIWTLSISYIHYCTLDFINRVKMNFCIGYNGIIDPGDIECGNSLNQILIDVKHHYLDWLLVQAI